MALAFGATVGIIEESGHEAAKILLDEDWNRSPNLLPLPADPATLRSFVAGPRVEWDAETRETLARLIHDEYQQESRKRLLKETPQVADWDKLPDDLREWNACQADDIQRKLNEIGCTVAAARGKTPAFRFRRNEVERLAEMEHARWNVERLSSGWRRGDEKDLEARTSPYLVSWVSLPERVKENDRQAIRAIPRLLAQVGLEVRREEG
jgi:hypothetical protein